MDFLEKTIFHLDETEKGLFRAFLQRNSDDRKDLKLFNILCEGNKIKPRVLVAKLYDPVNMNAYHSLRKRLMTRLSEFFIYKRLTDDSTGASTIRGMMTMGQFMLSKKAPEAASYYIRRAEKLAVKTEHYDLLDTIYNLHITHADELDADLDKSIEKWNDNNEKYLSQQNLNMAYSRIRKQLRDARRVGSTIDPEEVTKSVFKEHHIRGKEASNVAYIYKIVSMIRSGSMSSKDYQKFQPFVVREYNRLVRAKAFGKKDVEYKRGFLYMIAHAYYRNRKFRTAGTWLKKMAVEISSRTDRSSPFHIKYIALCAAVASYSGKNLEAINIMTKALKEPKVRRMTVERLNMQLNLSVYYFQAEDYRKASRTMAGINYKDNWLDEKMGMEWRFKKLMIDVIIQCELGHDMIALSKIAFIEKEFKNLLSHHLYERASVFLKFIKMLINKPGIAQTKEFAEKVKKAKLGWPEDKEDIQAITFFCWIKSKMLGRNYYEVLLETMKQNG